MSAEVEADMALGVKVNLLGMVNMFEAAAAPQARAARVHEQRDRVRRLAGGLRRPAGRRGRLLRPERSFLHLRRDEDPRRVHGAEICRQARASASPAPGRPSCSAMAASAARSCGRRPSRPSRRSAASPKLPFSRHSRDTWIYKDDCAEQLVRLALKPSLVAFRLQQRRRERDGGGTRGGGAPLAARRPVRVRRDEADDAADRLAGRDAARGGDRISRRARCSTACAPISTKRGRRRASSPCDA